MAGVIQQDSLIGSLKLEKVGMQIILSCFP